MAGAWQRRGECNHCGFCCETLSRQFVVRRPIEHRWIEFYKARGFEAVKGSGGMVGRFAWLTAPCPQHVGDRCAMGTDRPEWCHEFPTQPTEIIGTPCSYWFEQGKHKVGGAGSPYPRDEMGMIDVELEMEREAE
jgi:hypothetical protein